MRRSLPLLVVALLSAGCGDDGGEGSGGELSESPPTSTTTTTPSDGWTHEECVTAFETSLAAMEVPEGVDASDGLDDAERAATDEMIGNASREAGIDPDGEDPCENLLTEADFAAGLQNLDPELVQLLAAQTSQEFSETGTAIN